MHERTSRSNETSPTQIVGAIAANDPLGRLVSTSAPTPEGVVSTAAPVLPGNYTIRVRNIGTTAITYTAKLIQSRLWS